MRRLNLAGWLTVAAVAIAMVAGCSSGSSSQSTAPVDDVVPRIEPATGDLAAIVGTTFDAANLPPALEAGGGPDELVGSVILGAANIPAGDVVAMHWVERGNHVNVVMSDQIANGDQGPTWQVHSAWVVVLDPSMVFSVGTIVCKPASIPVGTEGSVFVAVVNREQDQAFGAWTFVRDGPTPYPEPETLDCERFVP